MTLKDHIIERITHEGPMRIDQYMTLCLLHPTLGYYTTRDPLGTAGDFITAPEISQMFGELLGLCIAQTWLSHGAPAPFTLAELGPGRGTLMADALRAAGRVPGFAEAARVTLVEVSPSLRAVQRETLGTNDVTWVDGTDALPEGPLYVIANEFFDALPIRQFVRDGTQWRERQIGVEDGALTFGLGPAQPQPALAYLEEGIAQGDMVETCAALAPTLAPIADRISANGGAALIVDYGQAGTKGDTFQAVQNHRKVDPLTSPGAADLTAHVDFAALAQAAAPLKASPLIPQGVFLERLGITERARQLARNLSGSALDAHVAAHRRLTHPEEMGNLFRVMALYAKGATPPPGLDA